jgi:hypothetical protein
LIPLFGEKKRKLCGSISCSSRSIDLIGMPERNHGKFIDLDGPCALSS